MTPPPSEEGDTPEGEDGEGGEGEGTAGSGEGEGTAGGSEGTPEGGESENGAGGEATPTPVSEVWKDFPIDPETGYAVDPNTGAYVDPETGAVLGGSYEEGAVSPSTAPEGEAGASPSASPAA